MSFFFFNDTATTEIYTLSLHDALPISRWDGSERADRHRLAVAHLAGDDARHQLFLDRKSTRLNSSHSQISYAVFCLKKKKNQSISIHTFDNMSGMHCVLSLSTSQTPVT